MQGRYSLIWDRTVGKGVVRGMLKRRRWEFPISPLKDTSSLSCFPRSSAPGLERAGGCAWGDGEDTGQSRSWCHSALGWRKELKVRMQVSCARTGRASYRLPRCRSSKCTENMPRWCKEATSCLAHPTVTLHNTQIFLVDLCLKPKLSFE